MHEEANNYDQQGSAVKADSGKPPMSMLPGHSLMAVARVLDTGAAKYGRDNWRQGFSYSRLVDAAMRHIFAFQEGEDLDLETGESHIAHATCCLLFLLHYLELEIPGAPGPGDDRPNTDQSLLLPTNVEEEAAIVAALDRVRMAGPVRGGGYIPAAPFS